MGLAVKKKANGKQDTGRSDIYATQIFPHIEKIRAWKAKGVTDEKIAEKLQISIPTFYKHKKLHTEFSEALKKGLDESVSEVEGALFKRAVGFEYVETKTVVEEVIEDGEKIMGEDGKPLTSTRTETMVKKALPDVGSMVFYLKNRAPEEWKDKHELEGSPLHGLSDADIVARLIGIVKAASART